jgi:hypothetical protein
MYRKAMEKSEYRLLPETLARMSVPQQMLIFRASGPAAAMQRAVELANEMREAKGLPPIPKKEA